MLAVLLLAQRFSPLKDKDSQAWPDGFTGVLADDFLDSSPVLEVEQVVIVSR